MTMNAENRRATSALTGWWGALALTGLIVAYYFFTATCSTLWDRDEPRFSKATVEMIQSGQYLYPTFNGTLRPDKPILIYWLMSLPVRLFGASELACRFCAPLGIGAVCLMLYALARKLLTTRVGLLAILIFAATPLALIPGTAATTDAVLLAFITSVLTLFAYSLDSGLGAGQVLAMGLALGAALLTKGPVGLVLPVLTMLSIWIWGKNDVVRGRHPYLALSAAIGMGLALFVAWGIPANEATGGLFLKLGLGHHVVERINQPLEHHGGNFFLMLPYYLPVIFLGFLPWTLYLPAAFSALCGGRLGGRRVQVLLLAWILPTFGLMSLIGTKLPHYILPIWPALALAVAATLSALQRGELVERDYRWLRRGTWLFVFLCVLLSVGLVWGAWTLPAPQLHVPGVVCGAILLIMAVVAAWFQAQKRVPQCVATLLLGALGLGLLSNLWILPGIEELKVSKRLALGVLKQTSAEVEVVSCGPIEPSVLFYLGRPTVANLGTHPVATEDEEAKQPTVMDWARQPRPGVLLIPSEMLNHIETKFGPLGLELMLSESGFSYTNGKPCEWVAMRRLPKI